MHLHHAVRMEGVGVGLPRTDVFFDSFEGREGCRHVGRQEVQLLRRELSRAHVSHDEWEAATMMRMEQTPYRFAELLEGGEDLEGLLGVGVRRQLAELQIPLRCHSIPMHASVA